MRRIRSWYHGAVRRAWPGEREIRGLVVVGAALLAACEPSPEPRVASTVRPDPPRWAGLEGARTWPLAAGPFASRGHGAGHYTVEVRVTPPAAVEIYRSHVAGQALPAGTAIAAFHRSRDGGAPGSVYVMTKGAAGWAFLATDADGRLLTGEGMALCARCHAEAPGDSVFGAPTTPALAPAGPPSGAATP
jgi:hypothetical protein